MFSMRESLRGWHVLFTILAVFMILSMCRMVNGDRTYLIVNDVFFVAMAMLGAVVFDLITVFNKNWFANRQTSAKPARREG